MPLCTPQNTQISYARLLALNVLFLCQHSAAPTSLSMSSMHGSSGSIFAKSCRKNRRTNGGIRSPEQHTSLSGTDLQSSLPMSAGFTQLCARLQQTSCALLDPVALLLLSLRHGTVESHNISSNDTLLCINTQ